MTSSSAADRDAPAGSASLPGTPPANGETRQAWEDIARLAAEVAGQTMIVGVRSNGTWFGHCGGIEVDAEGPAEAVYAVVTEAERNAASRARQANAEAKSAVDQAMGLYDTMALIPEHIGRSAQ